MNGTVFNECELKKLINLSERDNPFCAFTFIRFFFYHMVFYLTPPLVSLPVIYLFEGCNFNMAFNMEFLGSSVLVYVQWAISILISTSHVYIYTFYFNTDEEHEYEILVSDYIHVLLVIVCRSIVVGVKYGFFSVEHMTVSRSCRLNANLLSFSLVGWVAIEEDPTKILE